jgi:hypothetical protein
MVRGQELRRRTIWLTNAATNYIGDIYGTLGGTPDYGPADYDNNSLTKRKLRKRRVPL